MKNKSSAKNYFTWWQFTYCLFVLMVLPSAALAGKCYGLKDCRACTTCGYCKWCNTVGQTQFCSVYHGNVSSTPQLQVKAVRLPKR